MSKTKDNPQLDIRFDGRTVLVTGGGGEVTVTVTVAVLLSPSASLSV